MILVYTRVIIYQPIRKTAGVEIILKGNIGAMGEIIATLDIFKIQKLTGKNKESVLVYNKDKSLSYKEELTESVECLLNGEPVMYVKGYIDRNGILQIIVIADPQDW